MAKIQARGKLVVGTRFDIPGVAQLDPVSGKLTGFDADMARSIAAQLGISDDNIDFTEVISANRETAIQQGLVDITISAYVVTDERRAAVGQAGPYAQTQTRFFINKDNVDRFKTTDDLAGAKICATPNSSTIPLIEQFKGVLVPFDDTSACIQQVSNGNVDGTLANDLNNLGFLSGDDALVMSDIPAMDTQGWGVGLPKDDTDFCQFLIGALGTAVDNGDWQRAWDANLAPLGAPAQIPPKPDDHC